MAGFSHLGTQTDYLTMSDIWRQARSLERPYIHWTAKDGGRTFSFDLLHADARTPANVPAAKRKRLVALLFIVETRVKHPWRACIPLTYAKGQNLYPLGGGYEFDEDTLKDILGIRPNPNAQEGWVLSSWLRKMTTHATSADWKSPKPVEELDDYLYRHVRVEGGEREYFLSFSRRGKNGPSKENLAKTRRLLGSDFEAFSLRTKKSSMWTSDPSQVSGTFMQRIERYANHHGSSSNS